MAGQSATNPRAKLRAAANEQAAAATELEPDGQAQPGGNLTSRVAALIAGGGDPGQGEAGQDGDDRAGDELELEAGEGEQRAPGEADEEGGELEADEEGGEGDQAPATLDEVAKRLGMTRQEFNAIPVQVGGETLTLGELKAKLPELAKLDASREELEDSRGRWELERVASYRNIEAIIDQLPRNGITAGLVRQLEQQHERNRARELEALHFARPKWADAGYSTAAREKINALASDYGFSKVEVAALMDHRQVLLVQDFAELREKFKQSREAARKVNEPGGNRPTGQAAPARGGAEGSNTYRRHGAKQSQEARAAQVGAILRRR